MMEYRERESRMRRSMRGEVCSQAATEVTLRYGPFAMFSCEVVNRV